MADASEKYAKQVETVHSDPGRHRERAAALIRNATLEQELGRPAEAERLLTEAIAMCEPHEGAVQSSLGVALNELGRLYIRQSDFTRAEGVLERLLDITRAKGERHPDVATALAGLAVAKRGLGDDIEAEMLFRRALRIREEVLAPDHMAIVITLEQLSNSCAARGNLAEALVHLQRALLRRERALGTDHATVQAAQARIADLERRHREARVKADAALAAARERAPTPAYVAAVPAPKVLPARGGPLPRTAAPARDAAVAHRPAPAFSPAPAIIAAPATDSPARDASPLMTWVKRTAVYVSAGPALVVLSLAAYDFNSSARNEREPATAPVGAEAPSAVVALASATKSQTTNGAAAFEAAPTESQVGSFGAGTRPAPAADLPASPVTAPKLRRLVVPKLAMPSVDSLVRSAAVAHDVDLDPVASTRGLLASAHTDDAAATPPMLIGTAPTPHFPDELRARRLEGEVIVRFRVNDKGRVDASSMQVVQSEHELFTAAVRSVLPKFRFEPAHTTGADAKPQSAWVQSRFQFTAAN